MTPADDAPPPRQGYHHGNLKEALVATARQLIAERGPAGFTLAEAARLAGVSAAAPYRHFKDRDALIAEVAGRGFRTFGERLRAAWGRPETNPLDAFLRMGKAYLAFAREEPGYYAAMFGPVGRRSPAPPSRAGEGARAALEQATAQLAGAGAGRELAYQVWALSHGVATLAAAGLLSADDPALSPQRLLHDAVLALIAGSRRPASPAPKGKAARRGASSRS